LIEMAFGSGNGVRRVLVKRLAIEARNGWEEVVAEGGGECGDCW
jgi:hypothetical protein